MFFKLVIIVSLLAISIAATDQNLNFTYNGFKTANLTLDGLFGFTSNGLLMLTNGTKNEKGYAFYPAPVTFKNSTNGSAFSFSTTFVFAIYPEVVDQGAHRLAFVVAPKIGPPGAMQSSYLGLYNETSNGNANNHVFIVELDTILNFGNNNYNHLRIDIIGLKSEKLHTPGFHDSRSGGRFENLSPVSGHPMQVWVEYDGAEKQINVALAPVNVGKPNKPLLSLSYDLSPILCTNMYVGLSSSSCSTITIHYILGWSFKVNGLAQEFDLSQLPTLRQFGTKERSKALTIGLPVISVSLSLVAISALVYVIRRKMKLAEEVEDWELEYGPHRFKYKDLYIATKGFKDKELLGSGGFGRVYKGVLPSSKTEVAVKRVSHESKQGLREFIAEVVSIGKLSHRNLVSLLGYCRRKQELLLVYDYMPNGSLDKYLYNQPSVILNWCQRFQVIKGIASALLYLHEEWEQTVIHRDVKAGNVLLDGEFNGRLGDFGLARLYDHGTNPQTTKVVGTLGYLAPEYAKTGKATTRSDVFAFGAFLLEVACGRRPIEHQESAEKVMLVDKVFSCWCEDIILEARDPNLDTEYVAEEVELVLKLGLLCSLSEPTARPSMGQVVQYLEGYVRLPELSLLALSINGLTFAYHDGFDDVAMHSPHSLGKSFSEPYSSVADSLLSGGR